MYRIFLQRFLRLPIYLLAILLAILLVACGTTGSQSTSSQETILLWHEWSGTEQEVLDNLLEKFTSTTGVKVISLNYQPGTLKDDFIDKAHKGLGPDLIIGHQQWLPQLVAEQTIREPVQGGYALDTYSSRILETLTYNDRLYGLPLSLQTTALYYNRNLVTTPPATLQRLLQQAADGKKAAFNTGFDAAFWGIRAFGGHLLDADDRIVLNHGGFAHWLDWLIDAHNNQPNVILGNDDEALSALFTAGEAAYYVGSSTELLHLQEAMGKTAGKTAVGVARLPNGPNDVAGPLLTTDPFFFSAAASPDQHARALELAEFLTNVEHQKILAQQAGRIPANLRARIDQRVSPAVEGFVEQSHTAIPLRLIPQMIDTIQLGHDHYADALEGLTNGTDAANALTQEVNDKYNSESVGYSEEITCGASTSLDVWLSWAEADVAALESIGAAFQAYCPEVLVTLTVHRTGDLLPHYQHAVKAGKGPDLLLTSSEDISFLIGEGMAEKIATVQVVPSFLQRYIPTVPETMRHDEHLYGVPISVDTTVLYYKSQQVAEAPVDLDTLKILLGSDRKLALASHPYHKLHWGITAFGGRLFDLDGLPVLNEGGFTEWLAWLQEAVEDGNVIVTRDQAAAQELFEKDETVAFFIGEQHALHRLQSEFGNERLGVTTLPSGPAGISRPILTVEGFVLNPRSQKAESALQYAKYVASADSQRSLALATHRIPANIYVDMSATYPSISGFMDQVRTAAAPPDNEQMDAILGIGDIIFERVLEEQGEPQVVLDHFTAFLENEYGHTEMSKPCHDEGNLSLWHSTHAEEKHALEEIIANFARVCPNINIELLFVDPDALPDQLAKESHESENPANKPDRTAQKARISGIPHLILAPHDLIAPLSNARLLKPITPWVNEATLMRYHNYVVDAFQYQEALYGLPYTFKTSALYYNTELIHKPATSINELFSSASTQARVALDTSFASAFWGVSAFGDQRFDQFNRAHRGVDSTFSILGGNQANNPYVNSGLTAWLTYLQAAQEQTGIVMSADRDKLHALFATGHAAYLVADPEALLPLRAEVDAENELVSIVGVAPLPHGPNGSAQPLLEVDGFLFSLAASEEETLLALKFAEFATAGQSQQLFTERTHLLPANAMASVHADDPAVNNFIAQAESSILLPPRTDGYVLQQHGDQLYQDVLKHLVEPNVAMNHFTATLAHAPPHEIITLVDDTMIDCDEVGELIVWHSWDFTRPRSPISNAMYSEEAASEKKSTDQQADLLNQILDGFHRRCPTVAVQPIYVPATRMHEELANAKSDALPDLFVAGHNLIAPLAEAGFIAPITSLIGAGVTERFSTKSIGSLTLNGELYGLPHDLNVMALYYNSDLVDEPASDLDELLASASPETQVALETSFTGAYWGIGAFGGELLKRDGTLFPNQKGTFNWLTWLREAQEHPGFFLSADERALQQLFMEKRAAYLIAGPQALSLLREALGDEVRVLHLPVGPQGPAEPLLTVDAFFFPPQSDEAQSQLALSFAEFVTSEINQGILARGGALIPANLAAQESVNNAAIATFIKQAERSVILPSGILDQEIETAGDLIYRRVLEENIEPDVALREFKQSIPTQR